MAPACIGGPSGSVDPVMQVWLGDVSVVARVLLAAPPQSRSWRLERMLAEARSARAHVARSGRAHRLWGDGSLMAVALRRAPPSEPSLANSAFCACLVMVLQRLPVAEN